MALLQLSMATALLVTEPKGWVRGSAIAGVIALPMLILMTQSRGVFLGLAVFIAIAFFGQRRRVRLTLRLAVVAAILTSVAPSSVWTRMQTLRSATNASTLDDVDGQGGSARQRYEIWRVAFKIIRDHPITGVGFGAYRPTHEQYAVDVEFNPTARGARDTHSLYFNVLAETGFPGLTLYLIMVGVVLLTAERARRRCKRVFEIGAKQLLMLEAGLLSFLVASVFGSLPYLPHFLLHLVLIHAVSTLASAQAGKMAAHLATGRTVGGGGAHPKMLRSTWDRARRNARAV
jgi:O-antigen ligase